MAASGVDDYEFKECVDSFTNASARTRHVLYAVTIAWVLIAIATWNVRPDGWAQKRTERWLDMAAAADKPSSPYRFEEQYATRVVERMQILQIPVLGIDMDANDLGIIGGAALVLLMILLWSTMAREHENLCLGLYKVKEIAKGGEDELNAPTGKANLLYHALAMGQVLTHPPTLVRWHRRMGLMTAISSVVFLAPATTQTIVARTNATSYAKYRAVAPPGMLPEIYLSVQIACAIALFLMGAICWLHLRACARKWQRTFFRINPDWTDRPQRGWWEWMYVP